MSTFTFIASNCVPFDAYTLNEGPLGGTETSVIRLAEALTARGHVVTVFSKHPAPRSSNVTYKSISSFDENFETDVLVAVREWLAAFVAVKTNRRYLWTGDAYDQTTTYGIGDRRVSNHLTGLICVSAWHAATLSSHSGFPIEKTYVIRNGIHWPYFSTARARERKSLIYSSTPYRGLSLVPSMFKKLKERHPNLRLNVYSGYDVYGDGKHHDILGFEKLAKELEGEPGITLHGNVNQKILAESFLESSILFYPNTFAETSCITAIEAQAAGCVVLTSNLAALQETVGDCGILVDGDPNSAAYQESFIKAADRLLRDDKLWDLLSKKSIEKVRNDYTWEQIAINFESLTVPKT